MGRKGRQCSVSNILDGAKKRVQLRNVYDIMRRGEIVRLATCGEAAGGRRQGQQHHTAKSQTVQAISNPTPTNS